MSYRNNYKLEEFHSEVVNTIKEVRKFVMTNKILDKEDSEVLFACLKYLIDINGDVNQLMQRWSRVNLRIYSLLGRMEQKLEEMESQSDQVWKDQYIQAIRSDNKDHVARAIADTCAEYKKSSELTRPYKHLVKLLERTYKLSDNLLRVLEHLSNNMRQDNRDAKV